MQNPGNSAAFHPARFRRAALDAAARRPSRRAVLLGILLLGCGSRALVDASPGEEFGMGGAAGRAGAGGRAASAGRGGAGATPTFDPDEPLDLGGVVLPDCQPGFSRSAAGSRECTYLYQGACYDDALSACACACERVTDNRGCIIGGFLNPDDPQTVSCVQR